MNWRLPTICLALLLAAACKRDDQTFDKKEGTIEEKPVSRVVANQVPASPAPKTVSMKSRYEILIKSRSGSTFCRGETDLDVYSDFSFGVPNGTAKCLGISIDLTKLLGSSLGSSSPSPATTPAIISDGKVLRVKNLGTTTFEPARPLLIGPVVQDHTLFQGLSETQNYNVVVTGPTPATATGTISLQVLEVNGKFKPTPYIGAEPFEKIIHWQMTSTGFEGISRAGAFCFDKMEYYFNTRPLAIPMVIIESTIDDLIGAKVVSGGPDLGGMLGSLLGSLRIELSLISYTSP